MKTICGIIGVAVLIAGVAYFVIKRSKDDTKEDNIEKQTQKTDKGTSIVVSEEKQKNESVDLSAVKSDVVETISERHEEAKVLMEEAVKNIMSDEIPDTTKNDEVKKQLFDDIDKL